MIDFKITPNFSFFEMSRTSYRDLIRENRLKSQEKLDNLKSLCSKLLEPIRKNFKSPMIIHSAFRCRKLNDRVGGSENSQHLFGEAADFHVRSARIGDVFLWIWKESDLKFGQLIWENLNGKEWIHISLPNVNIENKVLIMRDGKYERVF
jgi:zinc D-Ala-D-Ala carboxypeptidase